MEDRLLAIQEENHHKIEGLEAELELRSGPLRARTGGSGGEGSAGFRPAAA